MVVAERAKKAIYSAIDEVNLLQPNDRQLEKRPETCLIGPDSVLSSLGLVNLVVAAEEKIDDEFGLEVPITDIVSEEDSSQFATIDALLNYVTRLLEETDHGD